MSTVQPNMNENINRLTQTVNKLNNNVNKRMNELNMNILDNVNIENDAVSDVMNNVNNVNDVVETTSMSAFCSSLVWVFPIVISLIQVFLWLQGLCEAYVLREQTPWEKAEQRIAELEKKINEKPNKKYVINKIK